jgi:hypothetical protein
MAAAGMTNAPGEMPRGVPLPGGIRECVYSDGGMEGGGRGVRSRERGSQSWQTGDHPWNPRTGVYEQERTRGG